MHRPDETPHGLIDHPLPPSDTPPPHVEAAVGVPAPDEPATPIRPVSRKASRLRTQLAFAIVLSSVVPVFITAGLLTLRKNQQSRRARLTYVAEAAATFCRATDAHIDKHAAGVRSFAAAVSAWSTNNREFTDSLRPSPRFDRLLGSFHRQFDGFLTILTAASDGNVVATHGIARLAPTQGPGPIRFFVGDRDYFREAMRTGQSYVSPAFRGRGFGADPIVAISAPVLGASGRPIGVVEGSLDLDRLRDIEVPFDANASLTFRVLDQNDRVVYASEPDSTEPLTKLDRDPLVSALFNVQAAPGTTPVSSASVVIDGERVWGASCRTNLGWRVVARLSPETLRRDQRELLVLGGGVGLVAVVAAIGIAMLVARRIARPLTAVAATLAEPNDRRAGPSRSAVAVVAEAQPSAAWEILALAEHLDRQRARAERAEADVQAELLRREQLITERTRDLRDANERLALRAQKIAEDNRSLSERQQRIEGAAAIARDILAGAPEGQVIERALHRLSSDIGGISAAYVPTEDCQGDDPADLDDLTEQARLEEARVSLALRVGETLVGVIRCEADHPRRWSDHELALITDTARHLELALRDSRQRAALASSEQELRAVFRAMQDVVLVLDGTGRFVRIIPTSPDLRYQPEEDIIGRRVHDLFAREDADRFLSIIEQVIATQQVQRLDYAMELPVGTAWFEGTASPLCNGTVLWVSRDVTTQTTAQRALEESEARHRKLVESASDIIYRTDPDGHFTFVNPAATRMLGIPVDRLIGAHFTSLIREDARRSTAEFYARQLDERIDLTYHEFPIITESGREVWIGQNVQLLTDRGRVIGVQAMARDMTTRVEVERTKDEFLALVSHELRTPLTSVRGSLGLLSSTKLSLDDPKARRLMEIATQNVDRLVRLVNDYLDLQRFESDRSVLAVRTASISGLVTDAAHAVRAIADDSLVALEMVPIDGDIEVDPDRIVQVLVNLLGNAVRFSLPGGTVRLEVARRRDSVVFRVIDHGRGIPADELGRVFERFHQVNSSDARVHQGSGLGLAISRRIVQQHGGHIDVASELHIGSVFTVTLPLAAPRTAEPDAPLAESVLQ